MNIIITLMIKIWNETKTIYVEEIAVVTEFFIFIYVFKVKKLTQIRAARSYSCMCVPVYQARTIKLGLKLTSYTQHDAHIYQSIIYWKKNLTTYTQRKARIYQDIT